MLNTIAAARPPRTLVVGFAYVCAITIAIQTAHMAEHVAQVIQKFVLHSDAAHGLIGRLDLEPVHFWFNTSYLVFLIFMVMGWVLWRRDISRCTEWWPLLSGILGFNLIVQMYHEAEHSVKLAQFLDTGMHGTAGILGSHFDLVLLHFVINLVVFLPLVIVFFGARLYRLPQVAG